MDGGVQERGVTVEGKVAFEMVAKSFNCFLLCSGLDENISFSCFNPLTEVRAKTYTVVYFVRYRLCTSQVAK